MASYFATGQYIEIMKTDNVTSRFPELVGALGVVDLAPIHPSTWFTVKVVDSSRLVKLQTTAMKPLPGDKLHPKTNIVPQVSEKVAEKAAPSTASTPEHIEQRPRSFSNVGIAHFTKGVAVKILGTNNVLQRVPHLVGMIGTIKDVPVHPITWFKIEFPSGQVVTFRPSAFKLNDGRDDVIIYKAPKKSAPVVETKKAHSSSKEKEVDSDFSVGMRVRIRSGELSGAVGEIMRFGNGWIQVLTSEGKIAKRAHELDFMDSSRPASKVVRGSASVVGDTSFSSSFTGCDDIKRSKSGRVIRSHPQYSTTGDNECDDFETIQSTKRQRSCSDLSVENHCPSNFNNATSHPSKREDDSTLRPLRCDSRDLEEQHVDCPFPLISLQERQARRVTTQEYVDREVSFNTGRPDLSYWVNQIKGAFFTESETDEDAMDFEGNLIGSDDCSSEVHVMNIRTSSMSDMAMNELISPRSLYAITTMSNMNNMSNTSSCPVKSPVSAVSPCHGSLQSAALAAAPLSSIPSLPLSATLPSLSSALSSTYSYAPRDAPQRHSRARSDSLCETDCEDNMSPDLAALSGSLSQHQKDVRPSMPTPMFLPPHAPHNVHCPSQSIAALYDSAASEVCPARFFLSSSSILSPRETITQELSKEMREIKGNEMHVAPYIRKSHSEWTVFFPAVPTNKSTIEDFNKRQYSEATSDCA